MGGASAELFGPARRPVAIAMPASRPSSHARRLALALLLLGCGDGGTTGPAPVAHVTVTGAPAAPVLVGESIQLAADVRDAKGAALDRPVVWRSSDAAIAEVDDEGTVAALGMGRVTITAAAEGKEGTAALDILFGATIGPQGGTVFALNGAVIASLPPGALAQPATIVVAPAVAPAEDARLVAGSAVEIRPLGLPAGLPLSQSGTLSLRYDPAKLPAGVTEASLRLHRLSAGAWTPVPPSAVGTTAGMVTGALHALGTYAVLSTPVDRLTIGGVPASGKVYVGATPRFTAQVLDAAGTPLANRPVAWTSSDGTKLSPVPFGDGAFQALAAGPVTVTATSEGKSASVAVTVAPVPAASVTVDPAAGTLYTGQTLQLAATMKDSTGAVLTGRAAEWTTSDPAKATVSATGLVTARGAGTVAITAASDGASAAASLVIVQSPAADWSGAADWGTFQGNASRTGFVPVTVAPAAIRELWTTTVLAGTELNPPATGAGGVYVSTRTYNGVQRLFALDASTGASRWSHDFGAIHSVHPPAFGNGRVYATTGGHGDSFLHALDAATGRLEFRSPFANQWYRWQAPAIVGNDVFMAGGSAGGMYRFDATSGEQRWYLGFGPADEATPAVRGGLVYSYSSQYAPGVLVADAATGTLVYDIPDGTAGLVGPGGGATPVLGSSGTTLLAVHGGRLAAFDLQARALKYEVRAQLRGTPAAAADGTIYVDANGAAVEARRESDGSLLWLWTVPAGAGAIAGSVIVTKNLLFVSTASRTYAVDLALREPVWSTAAGGHLALSREGTLFIARGDGKVTAVALK